MLAKSTMMPAIKTPIAIAGIAIFNRILSMADTKAPIHAPVPGSGIATKMQIPQKAYLMTTLLFTCA